MVKEWFYRLFSFFGHFEIHKSSIFGYNRLEPEIGRSDKGTETSQKRNIEEKSEKNEGRSRKNDRRTNTRS